MNTNPAIAIETLIDLESDATLGYFSKGHLDKQEFAIAVNRVTEGLGLRVCAIADVQHGYHTPELCDWEDDELNCLHFSTESVANGVSVTRWEVE